jgi:hypothetical protein
MVNGNGNGNLPHLPHRAPLPAVPALSIFTVAALLPPAVTTRLLPSKIFFFYNKMTM